MMNKMSGKPSGVAKRKYASGASKRKKKRLAEALALELQANAPTDPIELILTVKEEPTDDETSSSFYETEERGIHLETSCSTTETDLKYSHLLNDPGLWRLPLSESQREDLITAGPPPPFAISDEAYPRDSERRHFSNFYYVKKLSNGETENRRWLAYSPSVDKVFCFPCRLFSDSPRKIVQTGYCSWRNLGDILIRHESSEDHIKCMEQWIESEADVSHRKSLVKQDSLISSFLEKLVDVAHFLTSRNLMNKDLREHFTTDDNVITLFKLISKHDSVNDIELKQIQEDKLISAVSQAVVAEIVLRIIAAKFFVIVLDRDRNRISIVLRFCNATTGIVEERFVGFFLYIKPENNTENLTADLVEFIEKIGLEFVNCRGIGYGVTISHEVKNEILNINNRVFLAPIDKWNFLLRDSAESAIPAKTFFGYVRKIFTLFHKSNWKLLQDTLKLSIEPVPDKNWECSIEIIKVLLLHFDSIFKLMETLKNDCEDCEMLCDYHSIANELTSFEFVLCLHVWYEILLRVSVITKLWHSPDVSLKIVIEHFQKFSDWIKIFRETGFGDCSIAVDQFRQKSRLNIENHFRKIQPTDYEVGFFKTMLDSIINNMDFRLLALNQLFDNFGFIYDFNLLKSLSKENLLKNCKNLLNVLLVDENSDSLAYDLHEELQLIVLNLSSVVGNNVEQLLIYLAENHLSDTVYPNAYFVISCVLSIFGRRGGADKSKMQIVKNYMRSARDREDFSAVAALSIEVEIVSKVKSNDVLAYFQLN